MILMMILKENNKHLIHSKQIKNLQRQETMMFILEVTQELLHLQHLQQITPMKEVMNKMKLQIMHQNQNQLTRHQHQHLHLHQHILIMMVAVIMITIVIVEAVLQVLVVQEDQMKWVLLLTVVQ